MKTAWQEGGENDQVNQLAAYHLDISTAARVSTSGASSASTYAD
ncbi:MAG: hypothetical protein ABI806_28455 [Candidatus Solibacter sp.]